MRILIAEDNPLNQMDTQAMIQNLGYQADVVANWREVLDALQKSTYQLILMDVQMPAMDRLEATRRIQQLE